MPGKKRGREDEEEGEEVEGSKRGREQEEVEQGETGELTGSLIRFWVISQYMFFWTRPPPITFVLGSHK